MSNTKLVAVIAISVLVGANIAMKMVTRKIKLAQQVADEAAAPTEAVAAAEVVETTVASEVKATEPVDTLNPAAAL